MRKWPFSPCLRAIRLRGEESEKISRKHTKLLHHHEFFHMLSLKDKANFKMVD